jgi:hypothetical protein
LEWYAVLCGGGAAGRVDVKTRRSLDGGWLGVVVYMKSDAFAAQCCEFTFVDLTRLPPTREALCGELYGQREQLEQVRQLYLAQMSEVGFHFTS